MNFVFKLQRKPTDINHMHGDISDPDGMWICYTLEDEIREVKIKGETAIPAGKFEIKKRQLGESRLDSRYSKRFDFYEGQLWLQDVPNFTYVYLHCGNREDQTDGCPLVGLTRWAKTVGNSRDAYRKLYPLINDLLNDGHRVFIDIMDAS